MRVGVLGTGDVGKSLANAFLALNHEVALGAREERNPTASEWAKSAGPKARSGTFTQAAQFGEIVVLATLGTATPQAIEMAGKQHFDGKLVWDVTNPLDFSRGMPPRLLGGLGTSAGETHQQLLPKAKVIKVFKYRWQCALFPPEASRRAAWGHVPVRGRCGCEATHGRAREGLWMGAPRYRRHRSLALSGRNLHGLGDERDEKQRLESGVQARTDCIGLLKALNGRRSSDEEANAGTQRPGGFCHRLWSDGIQPEAAVEQGVTFFDTAEVYGPLVNEEVVGEHLHRSRVRSSLRQSLAGSPPPRARSDGALDSSPKHI